MKNLSLLEEVAKVNVNDLGEFKIPDGEYKGYIYEVEYKYKEENGNMIYIFKTILPLNNNLKHYNYITINKATAKFSIPKILKILKDIGELSTEKLEEIKTLMITEPETFAKRCEKLLFEKQLVLILKTSKDYQNASYSLVSDNNENNLTEDTFPF